MRRAESTARVLLRLYPRAWRQRYGEEMVALVEASGLHVGDVVDLVVGAVRERARQVVEAYGSAVVGRSVFTPRVLGVRIAVIFIGNALAAILGPLLPVAGGSMVAREGIYVVGWVLLMLRTGWLGWTAYRDRKAPPSSRTFARFEALGWMGAAVLLGALGDPSVQFSLQQARAFAASPISTALFFGRGGLLFMLAFDALVKQTASHRRWLESQVAR